MRPSQTKAAAHPPRAKTPEAEQRAAAQPPGPDKPRSNRAKLENAWNAWKAVAAAYPSEMDESDVEVMGPDEVSRGLCQSPAQASTSAPAPTGGMSSNELLAYRKMLVDELRKLFQSQESVAK